MAGGGGGGGGGCGGGGGGGATEAAARLVLVAVLLHSLVQCAGANTENNARLTTGFGKPQQKPQNNHPPKELGGFPCNKSSECDIANTTCMVDPRDGRKRCLCGDRSVPQAAVCRNKFRVVKFPCNADSECVENAECILPVNISTNTTSGHNIDVNKLLTGANTKICWCRDPYEITEDDHCSNLGTLLLPSGVLLLVSLHTLIPNL